MVGLEIIIEDQPYAGVEHVGADFDRDKPAFCDEITITAITGITGVSKWRESAKGVRFYFLMSLGVTRKFDSIRHLSLLSESGDTGDDR
jgi:hypothetical protein